MEKLKQLEEKKDYQSLISELKQKVKEDKRIFTNSYVKEWCGKRWRNIFINEAVLIPEALEAAKEKKLFKEDNRPDKQKIAFRYLRGSGPEEWNIELPEAVIPELKNTSLVFSPGMLTGLLPVMAFQEAFPYVEQKYNWKILQSDSHPIRSCDANVEDLINVIEKGKGLDANAKIIPESKQSPPKDFFLIGYSKGMPDIMHLLVKYPELKSRIRCIFNWAGAPGGSYLANSMYESIKNVNIEDLQGGILDALKLISPFIKLPKKIRRLDEYDFKGALYDLDTNRRGNFLKEHLDFIDSLNIPIFNITGSTNALEVPYFQVQGVMELNKYDANNDMQVTQKHSKIESPIATDLAMLHGHHWDISYSPFPMKMRFGSPHLDHPFPKEAALVAMFKFASELGLID